MHLKISFRKWRPFCLGPSVLKTIPSLKHAHNSWYLLYMLYSLQWRHNERDGVSNHRGFDCLLRRLFRRTSKKTSKLCVTGLCEGNPPVNGGFPLPGASNAEIVSIWWRHHVSPLVLLSSQCGFSSSNFSEKFDALLGTRLRVQAIMDNAAYLYGWCKDKNKVDFDLTVVILHWITDRSVPGLSSDKMDPFYVQSN